MSFTIKLAAIAAIGAALCGCDKGPPTRWPVILLENENHTWAEGDCA